MKRRTLVSTFLGIFLLLCAWTAYTQNAKPPGPLRITKVKGELYEITGEGGNVAVYVTSEGVVLVDNMFDRNHADILAQVKSVTNQPIRYALNTHQHDDHAGGDFKLLPLVEVIAHKNARANLADIKQPYYEDTPGTPIGLPSLTFADEFALHLGGKEVRAKYFGRGHTNGDVIIYFPELKTIHTGDLFLGRGAPRGGAAQTRPPGVNIYVDYAQGGSFFEWSKTLEGTLTLDFDTVIPGHGPISTKQDIVQFKSDLETMRSRLTGLVREGKSKADVLKVLETDYGWRSNGCPLTPPTAGCLQFQQSDAMMAELRGAGGTISPPQAAIEDTRKKDIYAVYSLAISSTTVPPGNEMYLVDQKTATNRGRMFCPVPASHQPGWDEVLADLAAASATAATLDRSFTFSKPYHLLNEAEVRAYHETLRPPRPNQPQPSIDPRFRGAKASYQVSEVFFNRSRTLAAVFVGHVCGSLCGKGEWRVFEKPVGGDWREGPVRCAPSSVA